MKKNYLWVALFIFLFIIRFVWIDIIPTGMQYDEIEYSLSGKTFQMIGKDLSGVRFPENLITTRTLGKASPVPYMILSPLWSVLDLTMAHYRSAYVILNCITAIVFIFLLYTLFKKKNLALLGGVLFLLNPWSFFLSRHAIDGSFALLFYLLGTLFILNKYSRRNLLFSVIFFLLGFFSYQGAKPYLIPLVAILIGYVIYMRKLKKEKLLPYVFHFFSLGAVLLLFVVVGKSTPGSVLNVRSHEIMVSNLDIFSKQVNTVRATSIDTKIAPLITNKFTFAFKYFLDNYFETFSPTLLFLKAEIMGTHGFFYFFEAVFLILGFVFLFHTHRRIFWLIFSIMAVVPITTVMSLEGFSILNRAIFLLPMFLICITYGLYTILEKLFTYFPKKLVIFVTIIGYAASFFYFQYTYFFILPIQLIMQYQTNTRALTHYVLMERKVSPQVVVISSKPQIIYSSMVFFLPKAEQEKELRSQQTFNKNLTFHFMGNITITDHCVSSFDPNLTYIIDKDIANCHDKIPANYLIIDQRDASEDYFIVYGKSCHDYSSSRWLDSHRLSDFQIEKMSDQDFCSRWIAHN